MRPRLLDLFCGAGGAAMGYHRAGFDVVGVDINPQPNYPFEFVQADALTVLSELAQGIDIGAMGKREWWDVEFDAIHASPPCQAYSTLKSLSDNEHPDLLDPTRELLEAAGLPHVIENVVGSPMRRDFVLCGSQFGLGATCRDGVWRQLRRHRWFETNWPVGLQPQCRHSGEPVGVYGHGGGQQKTVANGGINRGYMAAVGEAREALDIDWMKKRELSQAIPPAYTEFIGQQLLQQVTEQTPASAKPQTGALASDEC